MPDDKLAAEVTEATEALAARGVRTSPVAGKPRDFVATISPITGPFVSKELRFAITFGDGFPFAAPLIHFEGSGRLFHPLCLATASTAAVDASSDGGNVPGDVLLYGSGTMVFSVGVHKVLKDLVSALEEPRAPQRGDAANAAAAQLLTNDAAAFIETSAAWLANA